MKWCGKIGFFVSKEKTKNGVGTGVWVQEIEEHTYMGDVTRDFRKAEHTDGVNDNINIGNTISILSNKFISDNLMNIKYVTFFGYKFKVTNFEVTYPRIVLSIGGLYNEG